MKSIKPGRGPSMKGGIMSIAVGLFGVFWTIMAVSMGAGFMAIFGVIFVGIAVVDAVYSFKNATGENRYSAFDITDDDEEPDPLNERFGGSSKSTGTSPNEGSGQEGKSVYCPYCGAKADKDFAYCNKCGRKLP